MLFLDCYHIPFDFICKASQTFPHNAFYEAKERQLLSIWCWD